MENMETEKNTNQAHNNFVAGCGVIIFIVFIILVYRGFSSDDNKEIDKQEGGITASQTKSQENVKKVETAAPQKEPEKQVVAEDEKFVPVPGDEVFLRYDNESDEKIYIADTLENFNILRSSYAIKDNEARYELILNGNVIAVKNGTKVRILDYVDVGGGEKVRVLEGDNYNFTGYVPWSLFKKN